MSRLPDKRDVGEKEKLEEGIPNESDREYGRQRESRQTHRTAAHPCMVETEFLGQTSRNMISGTIGENLKYKSVPSNGSTECMDP